jgi:hypothetical protein
LGGKKLNFSHWFFKKEKTEQCDSGAIGAWLHCSLKIPTRSSKMLLLQSYGWTTKISGSYKAKLVLLTLPNTDICSCG